MRLGGSPYPRMDGNKVVNFLQEGHRMQKPEHVDNKLLVETFLFISMEIFRGLLFQLNHSLNNTIHTSKQDFW